MRLQLVDVVRQHGSHVVLDGVSLQVNPGTRLGLVGRERLRQVDAAPDPRAVSSSRTAARSSVSRGR